jgi:prepilin-type N-terminal cleavage/methylation domain-containing protein
MKQITHRKGFTLIELLTVIAIIGLLATALIPAVKKVQELARRTAALSKIRNVGGAIKAATSDGDKVINKVAFALATPTMTASTITEYMQMLSIYGGINDATNWYVDGDPANDGKVTSKVVLSGVAGAYTVDPALETGAVALTTFVPTLKAPAETVPIVWTRGLQTSGRWDQSTGAFESNGGHIYFAGGRVDWFTDTTTDDTGFISKTDGKPNANWQTAVAKTYSGFLELKSTVSTGP